MVSFNEYDKKGQAIMNWFEMNMDYTEMRFNVTFKLPRHAIARRFLNEMVEFEPLKEVENK